MNRIDDNGYFDYVLANHREVNEKQSENILKAAFYQYWLLSVNLERRITIFST